jgi:hypothetical protein
MSTTPQTQIGQPEHSPLRDTLLDTAFLLAGISAVCLAFGHMVVLRDARILGLPHQLLPELSVQTVAVIGGIYIFVAGLCLLLLYFLALLVLKAVGESWRERQAAAMRARLLRHPRLYPLLGTLAVVGTVFAFVWNVPVGKRWRYHDEQLPAVKTLQLKQAPAPESELLYLGRRDDLYVFKQKGRSEFLVVRVEDVTRLELVGKPED